MMKPQSTIKQTVAAAALAIASVTLQAQTTAQYEVAITNITPGQSFTPQLVATHSADFLLFRLGEEASVELEELAEGGDTGPVMSALANSATEMQTIDGLLAPGATVKAVISGDPVDGYVTVAAMLIPTNDTFFALNRLPLPVEGGVMRLVPGYEAGTEANDQSCQHIPGPRCGGEGVSLERDGLEEGYVYIGNGFHELGDEDEDGFEVLGPQTYDWRNAVARIVVRRIN